MQQSRSLNAATGHEKEIVMEPTVSVHRKGDDVCLILQGDVNHVSSQQLLQALKETGGDVAERFCG